MADELEDAARTGGSALAHGAAAGAEGPGAPEARAVDDPRAVVSILRAGAVASAVLLTCAWALGLVPAAYRGPRVQLATDLLTRSGLAILLLTPFARVVSSGVLLALRGELRFAAYAAGVILLALVALSSGV